MKLRQALWGTRVIGVLQIGGGFLGLTTTLELLVTREHSLATAIVTLVIMGVFVFGILAGLALLERRRFGIRGSQMFQLIQIPILASSLLVYRLSAGLLIGVGIGGRETQLAFVSRLGTDWELYVGADRPWLVGINLAAVAALVFLWRVEHTLVKPRATKVETEQAAPAPVRQTPRVATSA